MSKEILGWQRVIHEKINNTEYIVYKIVKNIMGVRSLGTYEVTILRPLPGKTWEVRIAKEYYIGPKDIHQFRTKQQALKFAYKYMEDNREYNVKYKLV